MAKQVKRTPREAFGEVGKKSKKTNQLVSQSTSQPALAVLNLGGSQHLVREGTELEVPHVSFEEVRREVGLRPRQGVGGKKKEVEVTLLEPKFGKGKAILKLLEHKKGPKITIMKYKAKSRYRRKRGFRAALSRVLVEKIS